MTEFGGTFFFLCQGENYTEKDIGETQSMKIQVKSGEIPVHKNGKKNEVKRRELQAYT